MKRRKLINGTRWCDKRTKEGEIEREREGERQREREREIERER